MRSSPETYVLFVAIRIVYRELEHEGMVEASFNC